MTQTKLEYDKKGKKDEHKIIKTTMNEIKNRTQSKELKPNKPIRLRS